MGAPGRMLRRPKFDLQKRVAKALASFCFKPVSSAQLEPNSYLAFSTPATSYFCSAPVTIAAASLPRCILGPVLLHGGRPAGARCARISLRFIFEMRTTIAASSGRIAVNAVGLPPLGESLPGRAAAAFAGVSSVRRTAWRGVA